MHPTVRAGFILIYPKTTQDSGLCIAVNERLQEADVAARDAKRDDGAPLRDDRAPPCSDDGSGRAGGDGIGEGAGDANAAGIDDACVRCMLDMLDKLERLRGRFRGAQSGDRGAKTDRHRFALGKVFLPRFLDQSWSEVEVPNLDASPRWGSWRISSPTSATSST